MPTIPQYRRQQTVPGVSTSVPMDIGAAGIEARGFAKIGEGIGDVADILAKRYEQIKVQDQNNKALILQAAYQDERRAFRSGRLSKTGQDAYDGLEATKAFRTQQIEKYTKDIEDPAFKLRIQNYILSDTDTLLDEVSGHIDKQRKAVTDHALDINQKGILKDAYDGLGSLESNIERNTQTVISQLEAGSRGEEEAVELIAKGESEIAEAYLDGLINRNEKDAISAIENGLFDSYLPQEKIEAYDKKAKDMRESIEKKSIQEQERAEKKEEERIKKLQEENAITYTLELGQNGRIDIVALRNDLRDGKITRTFYNSILEDMKTGKAESDQNEILDIVDGISNGTVSRDDILHNRHIIPKDRIPLLNKFDSSQDEKFKETYDMGKAKLKSKIITTSPFMEPAAGENERLITSYEELHERLRSGENYDEIMKDMIPRYDSRPDKLNALPRPRFSEKPSKIEDVKNAKADFLSKITNGTININTPEGQAAAQRELDLLQSYSDAFERMAIDGR